MIKVNVEAVYEAVFNIIYWFGIFHWCVTIPLGLFMLFKCKIYGWLGIPGKMVNEK